MPAYLDVRAVTLVPKSSPMSRLQHVGKHNVHMVCLQSVRAVTDVHSGCMAVAAIQH